MSWATRWTTSRSWCVARGWGDCVYHEKLHHGAHGGTRSSQVSVSLRAKRGSGCRTAPLQPLFADVDDARVGDLLPDCKALLVEVARAAGLIKVGIDGPEVAEGAPLAASVTSPPRNDEALLEEADRAAIFAEVG